MPDWSKKAKKRRFLAPTPVRTVTAQSQADPVAVPEEGRPDCPGSPGPLPAHLWDTRERNGRPGREEPDRSTAVTPGSAWKSLCSQRPEAARLVRCRRRIERRCTFRSKCSRSQVLSGLPGSGCVHTSPSATLAERLAGRHFVPRLESLLKIPFFFSLSLNPHTLEGTQCQQP